MLTIRIESHGRVRTVAADSQEVAFWVAETLANSNAFADGNVQVYRGMLTLLDIEKRQGEIVHTARM